MRRLPAPLSVTRPRPSRTTRLEVFTTFAVAVMVIVTGLLPQLKRIVPPLATAETTAAGVQLAGVPRPTTRFGWEGATARAAAGTAACPAGLPNAAFTTVVVVLVGAALFLGATDALVAVGDACGEAFADAVGAGPAVMVRPEPSIPAAAGADAGGSDASAGEDGAAPCPQALRVAAVAAIRTSRTPGRCRTGAT